MKRSGCHHADESCATIWTGQYSGKAEYIEYGFYCRTGAHGYEPCSADDSGAEHDYNRLYRECHWDPATQRMLLPTP